MNPHEILSLVTCVGHLGFAILIFIRRERSPLSASLVGLFGTAFAYTFADLAFRLSGESTWRSIDRFCSTFMAVLLFELVVNFVGAARALRRALRVCWALSLLLAVASLFFAIWWKLLCVAGLLSMTTSLSLLLRHRRQSSDPSERAATELFVVATLTGTLLGLTDLWNNELSIAVPPLGNLGMLLGLALIAVAVLKLRLLGRDLPVFLAAYALLSGLLTVAGYVAVVHFFPGRAGLWTLCGVSAVLVALGALREFLRATAAARQHVQRLAGLGRFSATWRTICGTRSVP